MSEGPKLRLLSVINEERKRLLTRRLAKRVRPYTGEWSEPARVQPIPDAGPTFDDLRQAIRELLPTYRPPFVLGTRNISAARFPLRSVDEPAPEVEEPAPEIEEPAPEVEEPAFTYPAPLPTGTAQYFRRIAPYRHLFA